MPAAVVVIGASVVLLYPVLGKADQASFLQSIPFALFSLANINYYLEIGYFDTAAQFKPLLHTWSLAVEEQFYLIWPTMLLLLLRFGKAVLPVCLILLLISLGAAELWIGRDPSAAYYLLPFRAFELLTGAALALLMADKSPDYRDLTTGPALQSTLACVGLALILGSYFLLSETSRLPGALSLLPFIGTVLIIVYGASGPVGRFLTWRPIVWIGLISYSLYLVHWPLVVYLTYRLPYEPSIMLRLALFPASIALAAMSYYFVEQTFRDPAPAHRRFQNKPFLAGLTLTILMLSGVAGALKYDVFAGDGAQLATNVSEISVPYPGSPDGREFERLVPDAGVDARVLILGDSHAGHLDAGFREYVASQGIEVDVVDVPGCPPLFGVTRYYDGDAARRAREKVCRAHTAAKRALALSEDYDAGRPGVALVPDAGSSECAGRGRGQNGACRCLRKAGSGPIEAGVRGRLERHGGCDCGDGNVGDRVFAGAAAGTGSDAMPDAVFVGRRDCCG
tara:strand:+ start:23071 stop:24597 length:1527 start_codon:yes stop_codon:yes gene_type:complete